MDVNKAALLKTQADSIVTVLASSLQHEKSRPAGKPLADNFNKILDQAIAAFPSMMDDFPSRVTFESDMAKVAGLSDVTLFELQVLAQQLTDLLGYIIINS
jgi:hypothetical protein